MKREFAIGLLVLAVAACQSTPPAAVVAPTEEIAAPVAPVASASIWGEVPRHCT
jgi:hypothetical protein